MSGLKSKAATAALAALMISLPADEGRGMYKPYYDIAGVKTVCYGHTGSDIENRLYSERECLDFLYADTVRHMKRVEGCSKREIPYGPLIGFTSFDFNTGSWCVSRSNREWNSGNDKEACRAMAYSPAGKPAWSYINGNLYVDGLHKRRIREMDVCLNAQLPQQ